MDTSIQEDIVIGAAAQSLRDAVARMHASDRERVAAGEIEARDLHFFPASMVRESVVDWSTFMRRREGD